MLFRKGSNNITLEIIATNLTDVKQAAAYGADRFTKS